MASTWPTKFKIKIHCKYMNIEDLQLQKLRLEMAANAISQIEIAQKLCKLHGNDLDSLLIYEQAMHQYRGIIESITVNHQQLEPCKS